MLEVCWTTVRILSWGEQLHLRLPEPVPQWVWDSVSSHCWRDPRKTSSRQCGSVPPGCILLCWIAGVCVTTTGGFWLFPAAGLSTCLPNSWCTSPLSCCPYYDMSVSSWAKCFNTFNAVNSSRQFMWRDGGLQVASSWSEHPGTSD